MAEMGFWSFAQADPEKFALADPNGRDWTRGELLAESNKIAHGLRGQMRTKFYSPEFRCMALRFRLSNAILTLIRRLKP